MRARSKASPLRLGAHMSIAGGFERAVDRAEAIDATALQVFVKSARAWDARSIGRDEAERFRTRLRRAGLGPYTLAHASYLMNLASPDRHLRERSIRALGVELARCRILGIPYLVLHPGSHVGAGERKGLERVATALNRVLASERSSGAPTDPDVRLLLETTAGQGSNLGSRFEHLARILDRSRFPERIGVCFDTCHAFAAGYDFRDRRSYGETFSALDDAVGLDRLRAFHLNDSGGTLGSRVDRHEHIGEGRLGLAAFRLLLNDERFDHLPMVLETPKLNGSEGDLRNLRVLRAQAASGRRRKIR